MGSQGGCRLSRRCWRPRGRVRLAPCSGPRRHRPTRGRCWSSPARPGRPIPSSADAASAIQALGRRERLHGRRHRRRDEDQHDEPRELPRGRVRALGRRRARRAAGNRPAVLRPGRRRLRRHRRDGQARAGQRVLRHADRPHGRRAHQRRRGQRAGRRVPRPRPPGHARQPAAVEGPHRTTTTRGPRTRRARSTPSRACASTRCPTARRSPTTPSRASPARPHTLQPQLERAVSWCRDVQQGRSFYTGLGGTAAAYGDDAVKQAAARRHPVGGGHDPRQLQGDDQHELHVTRLTRRPAAEPGARRRTQGLNVHGRDRRHGDGQGRPRVLRRPRGLLPGPCPRSPTGTCRTSAWAAARSTCGIRTSPAPTDQNAAKVAKVGELHGLRRQGRRL